jgi:hypothetical protein
MGVLDQQSMPRLPSGQWRWRAPIPMYTPKMQRHSVRSHTGATAMSPDVQDRAPTTRYNHPESKTPCGAKLTIRNGDRWQLSTHCSTFKS